MNRQAFAFVAAMLVAIPAQAETIVARSGEHEGFSRLVMRLPNNANWSLTQSGTTATLRLGTPDAVFDTSQVFNRIPRNRLKSLQQNGVGSPLRFQLGCECELKSYVQKDGYLVIDIRDGKAGRTYSSTSGVLPLGAMAGTPGYRFNLSPREVESSRMELNLAAAIARQATTIGGSLQSVQLDTGQIQKPSQPQPVVLPAPKPALTEETVAENHETASSSVNLLLDLDETARAATVNASEHRLLQQIGRATNQGLLDLVVTEASEDGAPSLIAPLGAEDRPSNPLDHLMVTTAVDRDMGLRARQTEAAPISPRCTRASELAVYNWGNEESFADQIGPLRSSLYQEFDNVDPETVTSLARTYLYFGFGAEARALLDLLPEGATQTENLRAMSELIDGGEISAPHAFSGQQGCPSDSAFWAALADGVVKEHANTEAIQQTLSRMPAHLRVHFGPEISTLFADLGDEHMASAALRSVDRTGVEEVPDINLAQAAIAGLTGDSETMVEELEDELADRTENAPRALIELITLSYNERKALSPDLPELVASYELETRDGELGANLRLAQVMALSLTGQFTEAFSALANLTEHDGPAARAVALEPVMTLLTERADDVTFLQYALIFAEQGTSKEAAPVAENMTRRLLDLGFAEQAQSLLMKLALEPANETRRLMMAEAALELELPHRALVELMGLDGPEANSLRARALWQNGEFERASEYLLAEEETDAAARGFWHSENLEAIEPDETVQFSQVAEVTVQLDARAQDPDEMTPLAHARALVESSVDTRDSIEALLRGVSRDSEQE